MTMGFGDGTQDGVAPLWFASPRVLGHGQRVGRSSVGGEASVSGVGGGITKGRHLACGARIPPQRISVEGTLGGPWEGSHTRDASLPAKPAGSARVLDNAAADEVARDLGVARGGDELRKARV